MLSKNRQKILISLKSRKGREKHRLFMIEGSKSVAEALASDLEVIEVYTTSFDLLPADAKGITLISKEEMQYISALSTPPGVLAVVRIPQAVSEAEVIAQAKNVDFVLVLDGLRDPGNLGTIIRTADWFGHPLILASDDCVELFNPKVVQASMGSVLRVSVQYGNLSTLLPQLGCPLYGMDLNGQSLFETNPLKGAFIIGSESHGIRSDLSNLLSDRITIPGGNDAESLNAAVSAAILLAEQFRLQ